MPRNTCEWMTKDGRRKRVCWSVDKAEKKAQGWAVEGEEKPARKAEALPKLPEIAVEAGVDAYEPDSLSYNVIEDAESPEAADKDLGEMTKAELLEWAMDRGHDLPNNDRKSEILEACKEIEASI